MALVLRQFASRGSPTASARRKSSVGVNKVRRGVLGVPRDQFVTKVSENRTKLLRVFSRCLAWLIVDFRVEKCESFGGRHPRNKLQYLIIENWHAITLRVSRLRTIG